MILSDITICEMIQSGSIGITPFQNPSHQGVVSSGLSSAGYDLRCGHKMLLFSNSNSVLIDPDNINDRVWVERTPIREEGYEDYFLMPPNSFGLVSSIERVRLPNNVMALCVGKSTYARCGLIINVTPIEPGFEGQITLEISNTAPLPAKVYAGAGLCQLVFLFTDKHVAVSYDKKKGKYQGQSGITPARGGVE